MPLTPEAEPRLSFALPYLKEEDKETLLCLLEENKELLLSASLKSEYRENTDDVFKTYHNALALYFLAIRGKEENREEYRKRAREFFFRILSKREELSLQKSIIAKYGYEMLPPINEESIVELKQNATLVLGLFVEVTSSTSPIRELYGNAAMLDEESAAFYGVSDRENLDALYMLAVFIDRDSSHKFLNHTLSQAEWQKEAALAKDMIFHILERDKQNKRANYFCYKKGFPENQGYLSRNEYLERSLPSFTGLKMLFTVIYYDKYAALFAAPVMAKKEDYLKEYLETTDAVTTALCCDFLRWHPYEKWIYKESHKLAVAAAVRFVNEPLSREVLFMLSKSFFLMKEEYAEAYDTVFSYLLEMGEPVTLLSRVCDEIDEGINVEENMEILKNSTVRGAKEVYEYKKTGDKSVLKSAAWELAGNAWLAQRELWKSH